MADQEHAVFRPTPKADDPGLKPTKQTPGKCPGCARQRWLPEPLPPQSRASLCLRMTLLLVKVSIMLRPATGALAHTRVITRG